MAEKSEIIDAIEALAVHCRPPLMSVDQRALWMRDWCADLESYPLAAIQAGCRSFRHSGAAKFPTPGQLLPLVRTNMPSAKGEALNPPWRPLSDEDYAALSLREKIRHQGILAHEARTKAGPMWSNTNGDMRRAVKAHIKAEDMPQIWHRWSAVAAEHEAEVARLRSYIRREPVAASR